MTGNDGRGWLARDRRLASAGVSGRRHSHQRVNEMGRPHPDGIRWTNSAAACGRAQYVALARAPGMRAGRRKPGHSTRDALLTPALCRCHQMIVNGYDASAAQVLVRPI